MIFELILATLLMQSTKAQDFESLKQKAISEELSLPDEDKVALRKLKSKLFMTSAMQCPDVRIFNGVPFAFDAVVEIKMDGSVGAVAGLSSDIASKCIARAMGKVRFLRGLKTPNYLYINVDSKIDTVR